MVWSLADGRRHALTDALASAGEPAWDANGSWLYFLASTDLGVQSGWADLGSQTRTSDVGRLRRAAPRPTSRRRSRPRATRSAPPAPAGTPPPGDAAAWRALARPLRREARDTARRAPHDSSRADRGRGRAPPAVRIDFDRFDRRILALPMPVRDYAQLMPGPSGVLFVAERMPNQPGTTLHKWEMTQPKGLASS